MNVEGWCILRLMGLLSAGQWPRTQIVALGAQGTSDGAALREKCEAGVAKYRLQRDF